MELGAPEQNLGSENHGEWEHSNISRAQERCEATISVSGDSSGKVERLSKESAVKT